MTATRRKRRIANSDPYAGLPSVMETQAPDQNFHFPGDLRVEPRRVERSDCINAALAGDQAVPENIQLMPERRDDAEPRDDHPAVC